MPGLSHRLSLFTFTLWPAIWVGAVPVGNVTYPASSNVVWETAVITKTTVICPSTFGSSISTTRTYTNSLIQPQTTSMIEPMPVQLPSEVPPSALSLSSLAVVGKPSLVISPFSASEYRPDLSGPFSELSSPLSKFTSSYRFSQPPTSATPTVSLLSPSTTTIPRKSSTVSSEATASSTAVVSTPSQSSQSLTSMSASQFELASSASLSTEKPTTWRDTLKKTFNSLGFTTTTTASAGVTSSAVADGNIFGPIGPDNILPQIPMGRHHPVTPQGIEDKDIRTQTNKFYANAFLGQQNQPIFVSPYSIYWGKGHQEDGQYQTFGMNIAHIEASDLWFGGGDPATYYINPPHRQSLMLTAQEIDKETTLSTDTHLPFSVNINLKRKKDASEAKITFPVVQGMSFVTGKYTDATPVIQCPGKGFKQISAPIAVGSITKYQIKDNDNRDWLAYIVPDPNSRYDPTVVFNSIDVHNFVGPRGFKGFIQIAKNPLAAEGEALYDRAAGAFAFKVTIAATVNEAKGTYSLQYAKVGNSPLLMFTLPHHIESLDLALKPKITGLQLRTTTKGMATAVWAEKLTFIESNLPISMGFGPWTPTLHAARIKYSAPALETINKIASTEVMTVLREITPEDSMYYAGKHLAKLATLSWILKEVVSNPAYSDVLDKVKSEMARYISNKQKYPLFYDDTWGGVVSSAGFNDSGADFGNTYFNDHHFHFGYFVYAAAMIGYLDPSWLTQGDNKAWINMLVKDFAESDATSRDYPFSRSFDYYAGHSWAKGLFESADGKDQESTSEDGFASFAIKMWGKTTGDVNMEQRGSLMLAIQARSFNNYFYLLPNNTNHPSNFVGNMVTGILFENKVDHATYFGAAPYLIHGIHTLPLSPALSYLRPAPFIAQEWSKYFDPATGSYPITKVDGGWKGVLYSDWGLVNPGKAWTFFKDGEGGKWEGDWVDGGTTRAWGLVWAAALGGG